jgi:dUTP pyrophosphatase
MFENVYNTLHGHCKTACRNFAILKVAFHDEHVALLYEKAIESHNKAFIRNIYCDSGLDIFVPENAVFDGRCVPKFIDMKVKTEMVYCNVSNNDISPTAYYLYARSSLSKTPLILANHVGIVDAGYRGSLIGAFKWLPRDTHTSTYVVESGTRLTQVCHPSLCPIYVMVVSEDDLTNTERGSGGFGSTG